VRKAKGSLPIRQELTTERSVSTGATVSLEEYEAVVRKVRELEQTKRMAETRVATRRPASEALVFGSKVQGKLLLA
jgi:hypothetical protein